MGSGASGPAGEAPGGDLRLPATGLRFSAAQLRVLNTYVDTLHAEDQQGRMSTETESAVESLVQRIVDGAGQRDPRFRCCHLIALHRGKKMRSRSLEYLVTLDSLPVLNSSEECSLQEGPVGYGKIRLTGREAEKWEEFLTPSGYLCRDKVVEKWVELLARCAGARVSGGGGGGGGGSRVLCARAAQRAQPYQYCYLERATAPHVPQERRLALVEGAACVVVRAGGGGGGGAGGGGAAAKLVLGARVAGCSPAARAARLPFTHPTALLHYTSAQGGYYACAVGPPAALAGGARAGAWQLRLPALEAALDAHCADRAPAARLAAALNALLDRMREGRYKGSLQVVSRYLAWCALSHRLERAARPRPRPGPGPGPAHSAARGLLSAHVAHHLLLVLDSLVSVCERGGVAGFVFPVERACLARGGARAPDWAGDAACIRSCLAQLNQVAGEDIPPRASERLELALVWRWEGALREWRAAAGPARYSRYSRRQLRYLRRLATELVACKNMAAQENMSTFRANLLSASSGARGEVLEQLVLVLAVMLDQARDHCLARYQGASAHTDTELAAYRSKKWNKVREYYDASSACLIDAVRRDPLLRTELSAPGPGPGPGADPLLVMKLALQWLHRAAKEDHKYLGPVLQPYLDELFTVSLENSWFLDQFDARQCEEEFESLREYCSLVHAGGSAAPGALRAAAGARAWARALLDLLHRYRHVDFRLVFPTGEGMAVSYPATLPARGGGGGGGGGGAGALSRRDKADAKLRLARRCVLGAFQQALLGEQGQITNPMSRQGSEEVLTSVKNGNFWRNATKPDVIPSTSSPASTDSLPRVRRVSRRSRSSASHGFPEISVTSQSDAQSLRRKYHTLRSLVYTEPVENIRELRRRPRSAGSTLRHKPVSRPSLLETLDFINSVKDALSVEESGVSDTEDSAWGLEEEWLVGQMAPLNLLAARSGLQTMHLALGDIVPAMLAAGKFTVLQELCAWLDAGEGGGEGGGGGGGAVREGALFALHRLARSARSRSSERSTTSWKLPEADGIATETPQSYKPRGPDYTSGDDAPPPPPPPPPPRHSSKEKMTQRYSDFLPPKRLQDLEQHLDYLEKVNSRLNLTQTEKQTQTHTYTQTQEQSDKYTGIINPIYDIKIPRDKFSVKRSKSLGRSFSTKQLGLEVTRYNITLGRRGGNRTNDVVTAINGTTGETGLELKSNFFQRNTTNVVGDSYKGRHRIKDPGWSLTLHLASIEDHKIESEL